MKCTIEKLPPFALLPWLEQQEVYPKFCFDGKVAALGSWQLLDNLPSSFPNGLRYYGGHAFAPSFPAKDSVWRTFPRSAFFLPQYELVISGDVYELRTYHFEGQKPPPLSFDPPSSKRGSFHDPVHLPDSTLWKEIVEKVLAHSSIEKVVLARRSTFSGSGSAQSLLENMPINRGVKFLVQFSKEQIFFGATPETLFTRRERTLLTEAVAGTRKRGECDVDDALLAAELLRSHKEKAEFAFVKRSIEEALLPLSHQVIFEEEDSILKTPNVQHIHNRIRAELKEGVSDADILAALHPTAAMGGTPRKEALEMIQTLEPFERGWYASPLGFSSEEESQFVVGIRSALLDEGKLHLFAGTGIVEESEPEKEWEELDHKIGLIREVATC